MSTLKMSTSISITLYTVTNSPTHQRDVFAVQEGFAPPEELEAGAAPAPEPAPADGLLPPQEEY